MDYQTQITEGMTVFGSDSEKVGKIIAVDHGHFVVEKGFFFPTDYYIPTSAVANVDGDDVYLGLTKDQALDEQTWAAAPVDSGYATTETAGYADTSAGLNVDDAPPFEHEQTNARTHTQDTEAIHVPVYQEELSAVTREVDRGAVRIEKDVVSEERTIDVPVTEQRVRVSRVAADPNATHDTSHAFEDGVIEVPLTGQEVELERTAHVAGEVVVEKETVGRTERASGTVRREEVRVDDQAVQAVDDVTTGSSNRASRAERNRNR